MEKIFLKLLQDDNSADEICVVEAEDSFIEDKWKIVKVSPSMKM
jgi:hypothetical protein